ncbi:MAG: redox-sensing transcriptional repressor Rex [Lachnospiraceae bacterium]
MAEKRIISKAVIARLPRYYRYLGELSKNGVERISSGELSEIMGVTASQIRQDLNNFGGFGQQGYGYNVAYLRAQIGKLLSLDKDHNMVILGVGNFGHALVNFFSEHNDSFEVIGLFDVNRKIVGVDVQGIPIRHSTELKEFTSRNKVEIGIITTPKRHAQAAADDLVDCGIKAIWNFANIDLDVPPDVMVENVHLTDSLLKLSYNLGNNKKKG